ncbi:hypothetical protein ACOSP7_019682 [Xanthoceras sorbifolium]
MCGDKNAFYDLDKSFQNTVKFRDESIVSVMGRGRVTLQTKGNSSHSISSVFFIPDLKTNLLSIDQLQEKGYEISIKNEVCRNQDEKLGLTAQVKMTTNRMFPLHLQHTTHSCFAAKFEDIVKGNSNQALAASNQRLMLQVCDQQITTPNCVDHTSLRSSKGDQSRPAVFDPG